jgi:hypothetical protein
MKTLEGKVKMKMRYNQRVQEVRIQRVLNMKVKEKYPKVTAR